jgi:hypothetical protein
MSEPQWCDLGVGEAVKIGDTLVRLVKIRKGRSRLRIDVEPPKIQKQPRDPSDETRTTQLQPA